MKRRAKQKKRIPFSFDSLADIVSNVLGLIVIIAVMVGLMVKKVEDDQVEKVKSRREVLLGKKDALSDIISEDRKKDLPYERESRYNRFTIHIICQNNRLFFVDTAELNYILYSFLKDKKAPGTIQLGDCECVVQLGFMNQNNGNTRDKMTFKPLKGKGLALPPSGKFLSRNLVKFFKLKKEYDAIGKKMMTRITPNLNIVVFHVFPDSVSAFNDANDFLRELGFDTNWDLIAPNPSHEVSIPLGIGAQNRVKYLVQ